MIAGAGEPRDVRDQPAARRRDHARDDDPQESGQQAAEVTVLMPPEESRLLTRELFYTAVTRAKAKVRVVGSADEVRAAIERRAVRATGLALRLRTSS